MELINLILNIVLVILALLFLFFSDKEYKKGLIHESNRSLLVAILLIVLILL